MSKWEIVNADSGLSLGEWEGETEADALDAMASAAGYRDYADLQAQVPAEDGEIVVTLVVR